MSRAVGAIVHENGPETGLLILTPLAPLEWGG
jgi:hypothetical protein